MGRFSKLLGSLVLLNFLGLPQCFGGWSSVNHGHGHGWMKVHSNKHHEHSSKLSEAYVKFHGMGGGKGGSNSGGGGSGGGKGGLLGNIFGGGGGGGGGSREQGWSAPASQGQEIMGVHMGGPAAASGGGGGGGGGWGMGGGMMMPQASSMMGWGQMQASSSSMMGWGQMGGGQMGGGGQMAKPTGWASSQGPPAGGQQIQMQQPPTGWAAGDFSRFRPSGGSTDSKGHFSFELPSGKPAWIQKLKPLIDLPKLSLKGWGWRK